MVEISGHKEGAVLVKDRPGVTEHSNRVTIELPHHDLVYTIKGIPSALGSFGYVPPKRTQVPNLSYFNTPTNLRVRSLLQLVTAMLKG